MVEFRESAFFRRVHQLRLYIAHAVALPDFSEQQSSELRKSVQEDGRLTSGFVLMSALSAGIATLGLLQSSVAVVIGAMLVSPLMSPIAALGFGFASLDGHRIRDAIRVVAVGAAIGVFTGVLLTWISPIHNATPEIIARTQPTLLDLAIALLSGVAGGYATVRQKGGTAIGVAIATALMPPLATVGYGISVGNAAFAGGAFLLFLTNLAAIAFSFALIARLSGVARPLSHVELTKGYIIAGATAFFALATPLGLTLLRVTKETRARSVVHSVLDHELHVPSGKIAQLEVRWPLLGELSVDAVVIEPSFLENAQRIVDARLQTTLGVRPNVNLQQIVAADNGEQTRAMIDAAMERNTAGLAKDVPPYDQIRSQIGLPIQSIWVDRGARLVHIAPADASNWKLDDYRAIETSINADRSDWRVRVVPPTTRSLSIPFARQVVVADSATQHALLLAAWVLQRWGVSAVTLQTSIHAGERSASDVADRRMTALTTWLDGVKIRATHTITSTAGATYDSVTINPFRASPSQLRAQQTPSVPAAPRKP